MTAPDAGAEWRARLIDDPAAIRRLLEETRRIAVLGIKTETSAAAWFVPAYAKRAGYEIIPVPVYYPELTELMGVPVYRRVADIPGDVDMVNVFRRSASIPAHLEDLIAKKPKVVWFQSGIRNDAAAERLAREGIMVVQDRCLKIELAYMGR